MSDPQGAFQQSVFLAMASTFEKMAFEEVLLQDVLTGPFSGGEARNVSWVSIDAVSPAWGRLVLGVPNELLGRLAEAILGLPAEEVSPEELADTLAELMNTIGGRIMAALTASDQVFQLGLPLLGPDHLPPATETCIEFVFLVQDHNVKLFIPRNAQAKEG